jgi:hypothetical protein
MANDLLERTRACFAEQGVVLPSRQVIYLSPLPVDCEQVAVLISGWVPLPPWEGLIACQATRWCGQFSVVVSRATPAVSRGSRAPAEDAMRESARIASDDAEALLCMVNGVEELGPDFQLELGAPQGGFQTVICGMQIPAFGGLD